MAYVDLSPIRTGIADKLEDFAHTSVALRLDGLCKQPELADQALRPIAGSCVYTRLPMTNRQYVNLVDWVRTGPAWNKQDDRHAGQATNARQLC